MDIIGFDVFKTELIGVRINKRSDIKETYKVANTREGIDRLLDGLLATHPRAVLGSEATGEYHNLLALACLKRGLSFRVLNPIVTKQFTKATVRKRKTDLTDAHVIARCLLQGEGELVDESCFRSTKPILRTSSELTRLFVAVSSMARRFSEHFPKEVYVQEELAALKEEVEKSMVKIRDYGIKKTDPSLRALLETIPGIGKTLSSVFISEIGEIRRFSCVKSLVAYAGLDPKVRQSGLSLKRNTTLTKRGSEHLRRAAFIAASVAQRHDPDLKTYYEKKRGEGKRYKEATCANARHILTRIYAVWKRRTPYQKVSIHT